MKTVRLTAAQALVRYLANQFNEEGERFLAGCWAIFGHGNVAGMGEALHGARETFPTWRGHNEQAMAHAAIAYAKQLGRRRAMAVTSSIGPGATNMVTAAALAHVNRLPVLLIPGDVFAGRGPDPVLQQIEDFNDGTVSANDCFRPVSRYFDRITRPEQLLTALPRALRTMTDPADCGPVTLAFCQDVQAEAFDFPESFFAERVWRRRRPAAGRKRTRRSGRRHQGGDEPDDRRRRRRALFRRLRGAEDIRRGDGHPGRRDAGRQVRAALGPSAQHGRARGDRHGRRERHRRKRPISSSASARASRTSPPAHGRCSATPRRKILALNIQPFDSGKHNALPLVCDARIGLEQLAAALAGHRLAAPPRQPEAGLVRRTPMR